MIDGDGLELIDPRSYAAHGHPHETWAALRREWPLARRSTSALFSELIMRLEVAELTGTPERLASSFVAGIKHLPIRYRVAARA